MEVEIKGKPSLDTYIGVTSVCLRKNALVHSTYAREFYFLNINSGVFLTNTSNVYVNKWPKSFLKNDHLRFSIFEDKLYISLSNKGSLKPLAVYSQPNFKFMDFYLTVNMWPGTSVKIIHFKPAWAENYVGFVNEYTQMPMNNPSLNLVGVRP